MPSCVRCQACPSEPHDWALVELNLVKRGQHLEKVAHISGYNTIACLRLLNEASMDSVKGQGAGEI